MAQTKQSNLIASVKMLNIGVINKDTMNLGIGGGGGYSVLVNYQSFLSNFFSLAPSQVFFFLNCRRNGLFHVNFIEQYDFIIYQHLNFTISHPPNSSLPTPLATPQIILPISLPRFKSIIFLSN